ncbi:MAG: HTH hxlR-type domain-containing protein [Burkholderia sp.]|jgi:DNA-binding HxlR family transcriptional regulator
MEKTSASNASGKLPACPVELTLSVIGGKWNVLILRDLLPGTKRFGELRRSLGGVSQKVLTDRLREMEARSLLSRHVYAEVPPRVEYSLTDLGRSLAPVLAAMQAWGDAHRAELEQSMKNAPASEK